MTGTRSELVPGWRCLSVSAGPWEKIGGSEADAFTSWAASMSAEWEYVVDRVTYEVYSDGTEVAVAHERIYSSRVDSSGAPYRTFWTYFYIQYYWVSGNEPFPGAIPSLRTNGPPDVSLPL
jgi:hypothetical protein